jgi:trans-AT polyketide synthase/acyltransferase/oxidoreductase domain-containing protein
MTIDTPIQILLISLFQSCGWLGKHNPLPANDENASKSLRELERSIFILENNGGVFVTNEGGLGQPGGEWQLKAYALPFTPLDLGDSSFKKLYGTKYALYAGSMANGIASEDLVITLGNAGFMGFFGSGGLLPERVEKSILRIQSELKDKPFGFNLLNSPFEPALEQRMMDLFLKHGIHTIEASAYLTVTSNLVRYRAAGLSRLPDGTIRIENRIIAKVSRKEIASKFLQPPSEEVLRQLVADGRISQDQAEMAHSVPMADDITVEADSGGHTDNRPLVGILPSIIRLRDQFQEKHKFTQPVRIGAGGGIGTPSAALAAFMMGAAYVVTGSINQSCVEAGASEHTRNLLAQMDSPDVAMAPASDMFEMGVKVQVLKRGTMFAMRAQKLYELYQRYESIEDLPPAEREKLETTVFQRNLDDIWVECVKFFNERDPRQIERAEKSAKDKMALIFRWYLGLSSRWSNTGEKGREMDYQIWTGPSMGAFNDWAKGTYLESPANRTVADISLQLMKGAAYLMRIRFLESQGVRFGAKIREFIPSQD